MPPPEYPMWIDGADVRTSAPLIVRVPYDGQPFATVFAASPIEL